MHCSEITKNSTREPSFNSGQRIKDFIDIHYPLSEMSLENILHYYCQKYPNVDTSTAISSLMYHNDIDFTVLVKLMDEKLKWPDVKLSISEAVNGYVNQQQIKNSKINKHSKGIRR